MKKYDVIILGAGPAGLTAGIYSARYGLNTLIVEKLAVGGQLGITYEIENYPGFEKIGGYELSQKMYEQTKKLGVDFAYGNISALNLLDKTFVLGGEEYSAHAIILAFGASERKLGVPNEDELIGKGVSYCAVCDGNFYRGEDVVVFGTGNSAVESAVYLANIAKSVTLICKYPNLKSQDTLTKQILALDNVKIMYEYIPVNICGEDCVTGIDMLSKDNEKVHIDCAGVFVSIGRMPDISCVKDQLQTSGNYIESDQEMATNVPGVFVAGDVRKKTLRQVVTACADGAISATSAYKYIILQRIKNNQK